MGGGCRVGGCRDTKRGGGEHPAVGGVGRDPRETKRRCDTSLSLHIVIDERDNSAEQRSGALGRAGAGVRGSSFPLGMERERGGGSGGVQPAPQLEFQPLFPARGKEPNRWLRSGHCNGLGSGCPPPTGSIRSQ